MVWKKKVFKANTTASSVYLDALTEFEPLGLTSVRRRIKLN